MGIKKRTYSGKKSKNLIPKVFSIAYRIPKKRTAYRTKLTTNCIHPVNPAAVTITFDRVSAMRIEQRMQIKKIAHFLTDDISMICIGFRSIKT
jgi:hypothetical protein